MTDDERQKRNVFFAVPILGFFRNRRQVDVPETQPIFVEETPVNFEESPRRKKTTFEEAPRRKKTAKEYWAILREHVRKETFHIQDWRTKTERVRTREQEKHFSEMSLPYEFSVFACVCAWLVYLGISVVAYSFVFEKWTVIEVRLSSVGLSTVMCLLCLLRPSMLSCLRTIDSL
jgi:hypothetical protein